MDEQEQKGLGDVTRRAVLKSGAQVGAVAAMAPSMVRAVPTVVGLVASPREAVIRVVGWLGGLAYMDSAVPLLETYKHLNLQYTPEGIAGSAHEFCRAAELGEDLVGHYASQIHSLGGAPDIAMETAEGLHATLTQASQFYAQSITELQRIGQAVRANPSAFNQAILQVEREFPDVFSVGDVSGKMSRQELIRYVTQVENGTTELAPLEEVSDNLWEAYGRMTGLVPPEASPQTRLAIQRAIAQPGYKPAISPAARIERAMHEAEKIPCQVRHGMEELPLYSIGEYATPETTKETLVYRLSDPARSTVKMMYVDKPVVVLQKLAEAINASYPLDPVISTVFRHGDEKRAEVSENHLGFHLRVIDPPPALKAWLDEREKTQQTERLGR